MEDGFVSPLFWWFSRKTGGKTCVFSFISSSFFLAGGFAYRASSALVPCLPFVRRKNLGFRRVLRLAAKKPTGQAEEARSGRGRCGAAEDSDQRIQRQGPMPSPRN